MKRMTGPIIIALVALLLLGGVFYVVNAFTGNPISATLASQKIRQYATETYPTMNLSITTATYNIKTNGYVCHAKSPTSQDTQFALYYSRGKVSDDYAYEVANHFTTYRRLSSAFDDIVTDIIEKEYPHKTTLIIGDLSGDTQQLAFDAPLDLNHMQLPLSLTVYLTSDVRNDAQMAALLLELHQLMLRKGIAISQYTLSLEEPLPEQSKPGSGDNLYLLDFPASKITDDAAALQEALLAHQRATEEKDKLKDKP